MLAETFEYQTKGLNGKNLSKDKATPLPRFAGQAVRSGFFKKTFSAEYFFIDFNYALQ